MSYEDFLEKKPLFYKEIDYKRMPRVWQKIKNYFNIPKIVHIVGTNGKGSAGRFLSYYLFRAGYKTGHYSSPHIVSFNERIWLNGENVDDKALEKAHLFLQKNLDKKDIASLSYFEYTTLMAMYIFQKCDYAVLEAGMGGEHDATSVFENILTLVTPIDFDHQEFLGKTIKEIASTKLKAVQKSAILGFQPHGSINSIAKEISKKSGNFKIVDYREYIDKKMEKRVDGFLKQNSFPSYYKQNILLAIAGLKELKIDIDINLFENITIMGRFQKIDENIIIDVGHNVLAAKAVKDALCEKKVILVYNSYKDKNYKEILSILKDNIKRVEIIDIDDERIEKKEKIVGAIKKLELDYGDFSGIVQSENYLVFGSFSVVEKFLKEYFER